MTGAITAQSSFDAGKIGVTLSNAGRIRIIKADSSTKMTDRISILVGGNTYQVFDYNNDADSSTGSGGSKSVDNPQISDFEVTTTIDNQYGAHQDPQTPVFPPNVKADINIYGWINQPYVIVKAVVVNQETSSLNAKFGLEIIPEIDGNFGFETAKYYATEKALGIFASDTSGRLGFKMLSQDLTTVGTIDWYDGYNSSDTTLYNWMNADSLQSLYTTASADGIVTFVSVDAAQLPTNAANTYYFALGIGKNDSTMLNALSDAQKKYLTAIVSVAKEKEMPVNYSLSQNYPNPFNPATKIKFSLPNQNYVSIKVYNTLGQEVAVLVNKNLSAGSYSVDFNAGNLPSGVYIYTMNAGSTKISNKMLLIK
jgi:hypothetical protein